LWAVRRTSKTYVVERPWRPGVSVKLATAKATIATRYPGKQPHMRRPPGEPNAMRFQLDGPPSSLRRSSHDGMTLFQPWPTEGVAGVDRR
jgi:hypothetical protein